MAGFGDKPFGLNDVKLTNIAGTTQVDLPAGRTLKFSERIKSGELTGDDQLQAVVAYVEGAEWSLEAGGISLEAYALMTGRTATSSGTTPSQIMTLAGTASERMPYFKIYGKVLGAGIDDVHCKIRKAKLTKIEGSFAEGAFYITACSGIAITDGTYIFEFVQHETAATLPLT